MLKRNQLPQNNDTYMLNSYSSRSNSALLGWNYTHCHDHLNTMNISNHHLIVSQSWQLGSFAMIMILIVMIIILIVLQSSILIIMIIMTISIMIIMNISFCCKIIVLGCRSRAPLAAEENPVVGRFSSPFCGCLTGLWFQPNEPILTLV